MLKALLRNDIIGLIQRNEEVAERTQLLSKVKPRLNNEMLNWNNVMPKLSVKTPASGNWKKC